MAGRPAGLGSMSQWGVVRYRGAGPSYGGPYLGLGLSPGSSAKEVTLEEGGPSSL